jgi:ribose 5-phosphate isomerase B
MIIIAGDKEGFATISIIEDYLDSHHLEYQNMGVKNDSSDMKLEDMIPPVVKKVLEDEKNTAILSCGTGVGVEVGTNKFSGIRACLAVNEQFAKWARVYDNCNVLCLSGWEMEKEKIIRILQAWFSSVYDGDTVRRTMFSIFNTWH